VTDPYRPHEADLVWTDFDPGTGREQGGRRTALVLSDRAFFTATGFAIVCPVTRRVRPFASSVVLPEGLLPVQGEILTSHVRSIDALARPVRFTGASVPEEIMVAVRAKLAVLVGIDKGT
jgi:mRNA interferase MazF